MRRYGFLAIFFITVLVPLTGYGQCTTIDPPVPSHEIQQAANTPVSSPAPTQELITHTSAISVPFPDLVAEIPLAPEKERLTDLLLDSETNRLYITDSTGQLHILDTTDLTSLTSLPATGEITLDSPNNRLFVSPPGGGLLTVIDTTTLEVTQTISPGGAIALNYEDNQLYVGQVTYYGPEGSAQMYNLSDLEPIAEIPHPGKPVYNPLRDELYLVHNNVYLINRDTLTTTDKLLPDMVAETLPGCNGCTVAQEVLIDSEQNLLVIDLYTISAGKGPGLLASSLFFEADSLEPLSDLAHQPPLEKDCFQNLILAEPIEGRVYREKIYSRYRFAVNLLVYNLEGNLLDWYEGLYLGRTNPRTQQMYQAHQIFDLDTLAPIGLLPAPGCIQTIDAESERLYGVRQNTLVVYSESGGDPTPASPRPIQTLPTDSYFYHIIFSPNYAEDQTVFVDGSQLYRSQNGGQSWSELRGGLPTQYLNATLHLTISPDFATDQTLFVQPDFDGALGGGLYRSTDGGDTWHTIWNGLNFLRVREMDLSPNFTTDDTLVAKSHYQNLLTNNSQDMYASFITTNRGLTWTLVATGTQYEALPNPLTSPASLTLRTVYTDSQTIIERSTNNGQNWEPVFSPSEDNYFPQHRSAFAYSPAFASDQTVFAFSNKHIYRSNDNGEEWETVLSLPPDSPSASNSLQRVIFSPTYSQDHTIYAFSQAHLYRSTDQGQNWELVFTLDRPEGYIALNQLLFSSDSTLHLISTHALFQSTDQGQNWETVLKITPPESFSSSYTQLLFSPTFNQDQTLYASTEATLFRSLDNGQSWQQWTDNRLEGYDSSDRIGNIAISPPLSNQHHQLFLITRQITGSEYKLWILDPGSMNWEPFSSATPPTPPPPLSTPTLAPTISPTATPPPNVPVKEPYAKIWEDLGGRSGQMGYALGPAVEGPYAYQLFDHGMMHWGWQQNKTDYIHILYYGADNSPQSGLEWDRFEDTWQDSEAEYSCSEAQPPSGPRRGFGKVWCQCAECRAALGYPLAEEQGSTGGYQTFSGGIMLWHAEDNAIYVLFNEGGWQRFEP